MNHQEVSTKETPHNLLCGTHSLLVVSALDLYMKHLGCIRTVTQELVISDQEKTSLTLCGDKQLADQILQELLILTNLPPP